MCACRECPTVNFSSTHFFCRRCHVFFRCHSVSVRYRHSCRAFNKLTTISEQEEKETLRKRKLTFIINVFWRVVTMRTTMANQNCVEKKREWRSKEQIIFPPKTLKTSSNCQNHFISLVNLTWPLFWTYVRASLLLVKGTQGCLFILRSWLMKFSTHCQSAVIPSTRIVSSSSPPSDACIESVYLFR